MFRRVYYLIGTYLFSLVAVSCVQDVILDAGDEPQVVVECILSDEPVQTLYLVYTKSASRTEAPELKEAIAVLTDLTEEKEVGHFQRTPDGSWQLEYAAVPAHDYRLEVSVPGHELIWAEQAMPETTGIEVGWKSWDLEKTGNDIGYTFRFLNPQNPVWFWGINYPSIDSPGEYTEYLYTNSTMVDPFNEGGGYFDGLGGDSFWEGSFSGFQFSSYPGLHGVPRHKRFLRFPISDNVSDKPFFVSGSFKGYISDPKNFLHAEVRPAELHYFSASIDYDLFLRDSYHLLDLKTSTDMADIFVRDNVHSNMHGAIGLFGAKMERVLEWEGRDTWQASSYFFLAGFVINRDYSATTYMQPATTDRLRVALEENSRPFELLHYEYMRMRWDKEHPDLPEVDWAPELVPGEDATTYFYLKIIQDQEQLDAAGLGDCGEIDFQKKKVLVCAFGFTNQVPILIGFGESGDSNVSPYYWPKGTFAPIILTASTIHNTNSESPESYYTPFRCALLIDKDEPIANHMWSYSSFVFNTNVKDDLNTRLAEGLAWNYP